MNAKGSISHLKPFHVLQFPDSEQKTDCKQMSQTAEECSLPSKGLMLFKLLLKETARSESYSKHIVHSGSRTSL